MALSYVANLKVPVASTWANGGSFNLKQTAFGSTSGLASLAAILLDAKTLYEGYYGGTFSYTQTVNGSFIDIAITFTGLTTDPASDPTNGYDIVSLTFIDDGSGYYSGAFLSTTICEDNDLCPTCPPSVNPDDATDCPDCYSDEVPFCDTPISILGLADSTQYTFSIIDQATGRTYTYTTTTDGNGQADLATADFPTGLFTPYNGPFTITINDTNGDPVVLTYGYVNYSCVEVTITNSTDYTP